MNQFDHAAIKPEAFLRIDECVDSFLKIADVISDRMYGNTTAEVRPWLSVVIPTYQRGALFQEALESVLAQKPVGFCWEVVVSDNTPLGADGSTPALEVVRALGDQRVLYFHNRTNLGSGYNWNRGVELARGEWICFLHDDDLLLPDALENVGRQIAGFWGKQPLGYLHARRQDFSGCLAADAFRQYPPERLTRFGVMLSGCTGAGAPTCGTTILKKAYCEVGGINYDFGLSADAVLCYQIMKNYAVICSDRILGGCRWGDNETLKKATLLHLIRSDELLSLYTYKTSPFAAWWGRVFGAASSWRNIHRKQKVAAQNGVEIFKAEFRGSAAYPEPNAGKKLLFLGMYAFYRSLRLTDGWIHKGLSPWRKGF